MRGLPVIVLLMLGLLGDSLGVTVSDGEGYSFSLESVKVLKRLMEKDAMERLMEMEARASARMVPHRLAPARPLCSNPTLPQELKPVCLDPRSDEVFARFAEFITPSDLCEICAYPACTGCIY
ncbi:guanylin-like [Sardina pilchardus]|uniref:guanylin-like n=1 Tax=Sardina pilchardus TaxID=27697 RepID=UPI002E0E844B